MTHDSREALEPCPFCGGTNVMLSHKWDYGFIRCYPYCNGCGACGPSFNGEEEARAWWNTRDLTASPGEQKPVAWIDFADNGNVRLWTSEQRRADAEMALGRKMTPVYTSPPPAAGWDEAIEAATLICRDVANEADGNASRAAMAEELAATISALRSEAPAPEGVSTPPAAVESSASVEARLREALTDIAAISACVAVVENPTSHVKMLSNINAVSVKALKALSIVGDEAKKSEGGVCETCGRDRQ